MRLIDADQFGVVSFQGKSEDFIEGSLFILDKIYDSPTVERPHGEWIVNNRYKRKGKKFLDCSECHYGENGDIICEVNKIPRFCPNCGASMEGIKNG